MWQRNDTGSAVHVSVWPDEEHPDQWPFVVGAGEEKDFHRLIGGFTPIEPPKQKRKDAAAAAVKEEGEPQ